MSRHVNAIAGRLSLRAPQRRSLEILDRITEIVPPRKGADIASALEIIHSEFPNLTVKKIPKQVLSCCEWEHGDYSLQIENLPKAPVKPGQQSLFDSREDAKARR